MECLECKKTDEVMMIDADRERITYTCIRCRIAWDRPTVRGIESELEQTRKECREGLSTETSVTLVPLESVIDFVRGMRPRILYDEEEESITLYRSENQEDNGEIN